MDLTENNKKIKLLKDLKVIDFEDEIIIEDNKINFYFANAEYLFEIPMTNNVMYFDGYLTLDLTNKKAEIEVVSINDDDERFYYLYEPTEEETQTLINASNEYCKKYAHMTLEEMLNEYNEEEANEQ